MELSETQREAVEYLGTPTLVVAGAGSGKTRTLTAKIAHLVKNGYEPERILAITFTNKAADEMKSRLIQLTGISANRFPWVRTYHSACFRILKKHCHLLGFHYPLQIYTTYQQQKIVRDILVGKLNYGKKHVPNVAAQISNAKNTGDPVKYFEKNRLLSRIPMKSVYESYESELKAKNAVDFDNILLLTRDLLRNHQDIRKMYQDYFQFILCDEYQDTNNINEELTRLLMKNGNLFVTGDDWQSIYSFRMSNVEHFLSFKKNFKNARIFRLEQNYRSANSIVRLANKLIGNNKRRMEKECYSDIEGGFIDIQEFETDEAEAEWVAGKVRQLAATRKIPYAEMGVLYRTKFSSLAFERVFRKNGIPYHMMGGKGFFERREIMDLNCYLTASVFDKDDTSLERIINVPKRGIGPGTLKKIYAVKDEHMGLKDAVRKVLEKKIMTPKIYNALNHLIRLLDEIRDMPPNIAIQHVMDAVDYRGYMESYSMGKADYTSRMENIEQLVYSASQKETIIDYLEEASLIKEDKAEEEEETGNSGVRLSTIHASKGLEYQVVFVVACEETVLPHWRSMEKKSDLEEERRLMYVSMTRSRQDLYLSHANFRMGRFNYRSRFLDEIEDALMSEPV